MSKIYCIYFQNGLCLMTTPRSYGPWLCNVEACPLRKMKELGIQNKGECIEEAAKSIG